jgi:dTDP-4-amino-4,6-dideoxygalactose transaminase
VFDDRDRVAAQLRDEGIYAPIHWGLQDFVPQAFMEAHALSKNILTLPCDHRYDKSEMQYIIETIRRIIAT